MNKESAAEYLEISVRSLQRLVSDNKISRIQKRGNSGKLETFFNADELEEYKKLRDTETIKPASVTSNDMALARSDANQFIELFKEAIAPKQKALTVEIADKPLLKLDEAAALTGLSRDILREAINSKKLKGKLIGKAYRIKRTDLDAFISKL
jgi:excisionase family DNA binding protein